MRKILALALIAALAAACAHTGDMPTVRTGNDPDTSKTRPDGRAAGAGGSNAPGGAGNFSGAGSAR